MKKDKRTFFSGIIIGLIIFLTIAAVSRQIMGPSTGATDNAIILWDGTSGFKAKNSGIIVTEPATINYSESIPKILSLGTISGGGTATLLSTNNQYTATFSGTTATIALPSTPDDGVWIVHGTTTSTSEQILTIPSLIRPELDNETAITTITNNSVTSSGKFTIAFTAIGGNFVKVSVVGDAL